MIRAAVETADGVFDLDLELEDVIAFEAGAALPPAAEPDVPLPGVLAVAGTGSTLVAVLDRRPPLVVSYDAGATWTEAGGGLPRGRAVAVAETNPDVVLYGARNRLYLSTDGGRFWRALAFEVPEIVRLAVTEA